jgi:predicted Zn-dependent peptidase
MNTKYMVKVVAAGMALSLISVPALAQKKVKDLKYPPLNQIEIPEPEKVTLDNGLTLYLLEDHSLPLINIRARLHCGSYLDPQSKVGLAGVTGSVMRTGGTTQMTGDDIDAKLEAIGASVETDIGSTSGSATANAISDYSETVIGVLADVLRRPVFDQDKIDLALTESRSDISRRNDDPMQINVREFRKLLYGKDSPYARHTEYATVESITRDDLVAFHGQYIQPQGVRMAVWGDFDTAEMVELIKSHFGDWERGAQEVPNPPEVSYEFKPSINYAEKTDINQSNIFIGHIGGKMGDPDYPATIVMNNVLGGFGGRLFGGVRTDKGLAYAVSGTYSFGFASPGMFYTFTSTKSATTVEAVEACMVEIERMKTEAPTEDEMRRAKDGYLNSFVFNFDTQSEVLGRMMTYDHYGFPADYLQQVKEGVEKVTPQDVLEVAGRKLNTDALQIMVTGNGPEFGRPLTEMGEVNVIDINIPGPTAAAFAATEEELAKGKEMLAKTVQACGGLEAFQKAEALQRESKVTVNMPQGSMELGVTSLTVFPDASRQIMKTPMGDQTIVFNGSEGWMEMAGQKQALPTDQKADMRKDSERNMVRLFQTSDAPDYQVAFKGNEDFGGTPKLRLDFMTASGGQFTMYVSDDTYRPAGLRYMGQTQAGPAEITEALDAWKQFGEVWLPGTIHRDEGTMSMDIEVTSVDLNPTYNEVDFQMPDNL